MVTRVQWAAVAGSRAASAEARAANIGWNEFQPERPVPLSPDAGNRPGLRRRPAQPEGHTGLARPPEQRQAPRVLDRPQDLVVAAERPVPRPRPYGGADHERRCMAAAA